ncbi:MAG TPA: NUDIX domain-containing protein [Kribbellaceae bacterium]|jgi:ADP-ribose pyrophosphatase YjhB (NUDIX family)
MNSDRIDCVGALVYDGRRRLLLVQRGHEPDAGRWSLPGGRVEPGEDDSTALSREVAEETGLAVTVGELVGQVERDALDGRTYVIRDYHAVPVGGVLAAGDDAADARFVDRAELERLPTSKLLVDTLAQWNALPG